MLVMGRTESKARFTSQAAIPASKMAFVNAKNILASSSTVGWSRRETNSPNRSQCPGGSSVRGPLAQYSAIIFCSSVRFALMVIRSFDCCRYVSEPYRAGPNWATKERNWSGEVMAKGTTRYHCAPTKAWVMTWGIGRVAPSSYFNGCQWSGSSTDAGLTGTVLAGFTEAYPVQSEYAPGCRSPSWLEPSL